MGRGVLDNLGESFEVFILGRFKEDELLFFLFANLLLDSKDFALGDKTTSAVESLTEDIMFVVVDPNVLQGWLVELRDIGASLCLSSLVFHGPKSLLNELR